MQKQNRRTAQKVSEALLNRDDNKERDPLVAYELLSLRAFDPVAYLSVYDRTAALEGG